MKTNGYVKYVPLTWQDLNSLCANLDGANVDGAKPLSEPMLENC